MRLKCKITDKWIHIQKNKYYNIEFMKKYISIRKYEEYNFYKLESDDREERLTDDPKSSFYIYDYFYTKEELRAMKIKELLKD
jgi:hypothetical protein